MAWACTLKPIKNDGLRCVYSKAIYGKLSQGILDELLRNSVHNGLSVDILSKTLDFGLCLGTA